MKKLLGLLTAFAFITTIFTPIVLARKLPDQAVRRKNQITAMRRAEIRRKAEQNKRWFEFQRKKAEIDRDRAVNPRKYRRPYYRYPNHTKPNFYHSATAVDAPHFAEEVLRLVNIERKKAGVQPLRLTQELQEAAYVRAHELLIKFSHTRPDGRKCNTAVPNGKYGVGENISAGRPDAEQVVAAWMRSKGHRANILHERFSELGVGYVYKEDSKYGHYWVQLFKGY